MKRGIAFLSCGPAEVLSNGNFQRFGVKVFNLIKMRLCAKTDKPG